MWRGRAHMVFVVVAVIKRYVILLFSSAQTPS